MSEAEHERLKQLLKQTLEVVDELGACNKAAVYHRLKLRDDWTGGWMSCLEALGLIEVIHRSGTQKLYRLSEKGKRLLADL